MNFYAICFVACSLSNKINLLLKNIWNMSIVPRARIISQESLEVRDHELIIGISLLAFMFGIH